MRVWQRVVDAAQRIWMFAVVVAGAVLCFCVAAQAQSSLSNRAMRSVGDDPRGLPIETFVQKPLPLLAREMLLESHLDDHANIPRLQRRGLQVELFAPGDFGVVVRYRW